MHTMVHVGSICNPADPINKPQVCPCGRLGSKGQPLAMHDCCGPLHAGSPAPSAERLMRSRYSAFVLGLESYLLSTWHPSHRPVGLTLEAGAKWLGLEIKDYKSTGTHTAEVEFVARYRLAGQAVRQHERSRFVREGEHWFYVDGHVR